MKISVIVPIYNLQDYIGKCIKSIQNQSHRDMEIILVDDGSTDCSGVICDEYAKEDVRISVIHKSNGGLVSARKAGANSASGEYIINVDGDDWIEGNYIENFVKEIENYEADIIWSVSHIKDYKNYQRLWLPEYIWRVMSESQDAQKQLLRLVFGEEGFQNDIDFSNCGKCICRTIYCKAQNNVDDKTVLGEDVVRNFICLSLTNSIRFIRNDGYHYVQREASLTHDSSQYFADRIEKLMQNIMNYFEEVGQDSPGLKRMVIGYYIRMRIWYDFGSLQNSTYGFLYPYINVKKGSRLILCGTGVVGKSIMAYLQTSVDYTVVAWIDSNTNGEVIDGMEIGSMDMVNQWIYDYIVLATTKAVYSQEMKRELMAKGVAENKIGEMNQKIMENVNI